MRRYSYPLIGIGVFLLSLAVLQFALAADPPPTGPPVVTLTASPSSAPSGSEFTLTWTVSQSATSCTAGGDWSGSKSPSGGSEKKVIYTGVQDSYTFSLTCFNSLGSGSASATVTIPHNHLLPASGGSVNATFTTSATTITQGGFVDFRIQVNEPVLGGEYWEYRVWWDCSNTSSINTGTCGQPIDPDGTHLHPNYTPGGAGSYSYFWSHRYDIPGSFNAVVQVVDRGDAGGPYGRSEFRTFTITVNPANTDMDVTPDDGSPSGAKTNESNNGGPSGDATANPGETKSYSATFTSNNAGPERGYKFYLKDPDGVIRQRVPSTSHLALTGSPQTKTANFTFNQGSGIYTVCAWGAQEEGLDTGGGLQAQEGKRGFFAWLSGFFKEADAAFTGVGASDTECKSVTVGSPPSVKLYAQDPNTGAYNDISVTIPSNTGTTLKWDTNGATSCTAASFPNGHWSGSKPTGTNRTEPTGLLTESVTYVLTCNGISDDVVVYIAGEPPPPPPPPPPGDPSGPSIDLLIDGELAGPGGQVTRTQGSTGVLTWFGSGVRNCSASAQPFSPGWNGPKNAFNDTGETYTFDQSRIYTITCDGVADGSRPSDFVSVYVPRAARVTLRGDNETGTINRAAGTPVKLEWFPRFDPTRCYVPDSGIQGWSGEKSLGGADDGDFTMVSPTVSTTYRIRCQNDLGGETSALNVVISDVWVKLFLNGQPGPGPVDVPSGSNGTLSWTTGPDVDECRANPTAPGWSGSKNNLGGSTNLGPLTAPQSYTIECRKHSASIFGFQLCSASSGWGNGACQYTSATVTSNIIAEGDLDVTLTANVAGGAYTRGPINGEIPLNDVGLKADVVTVGSGDITYTFYCDASGPSQAPFSSSNTTVLSSELCDYTTGGTKTARVVATKGSLTSTSDVIINVEAPPISISGANEEFTFCSAQKWRNPKITWNTSGDTQQEAIIVITRPVEGAYVSPQLGSSHGFQVPNGVINDPGTYSYRVDVTGQQGGTDTETGSFQTLPYQGPSVNLVLRDPPGAQTEAQTFFDNNTNYHGQDPNNFTHEWEFDRNGSSATPPTSGGNLPDFDGITIYNSSGNKSVRLTVTDPTYSIPLYGGPCLDTDPVNVGTGLNLPIFREIIPR